MIDFILFNSLLDIDVKLRTDANSVDDERFTILDVNDQDTDTEKKVVNLSFRKGLVITKKALVDLATDNNLVLIAQVKGGTQVNPDVVIVEQQLEAPDNFTATADSDTEISLAWDAVAGASGYVLQRATNSGFSANLVTVNIDDPETEEYAVASLTAATQYYFRIKAVGLNFTDSEYATDDATTQAE